MDERAALIAEARNALYAAFRYRVRPQSNVIVHVAEEETTNRKNPGPKATRPAVYSRPLLVDGQQLTGRTHRALAELTQQQQQWLNWNYRPVSSARDAYGQAFHRGYFAEYAAERLPGCKTGARHAIRYLIAKAMRQTQDINPGYVPSPPHHLSQITRNAWNRKYRPHWQAIIADLDRLDSEACYALGLRLSEKEQPID